MASIPGGASDKLGNEFERLWTIRQLIRVVAGNAVTVTIEALGDDERGTEFWVSRLDGSREAHQCKRENGSHGTWSISDLNSRKILANAKFQLDRSPQHHFVFVSSDAAPSMADLSERAQRGDAPDVFCTEAVSTSQDLKSEFGNLCRFLDFDPGNPVDQPRIKDYLQRFIVQLAYKSSLRSEVDEHTGAFLTGDPSETVAHLESFISRNEIMGKQLGEAEILAALPADVRPRDLGKDATLPTKIRELRDRFYRTYRHLLIGGKTLGRPDTAAIMAKLTSDDGPRLILIHGPGSTGKTGIIYEIVSELETASIPTLPLRLDQDKPADSPTLYGQTLELPASPAACLRAVADGKIAVLVLDQLDAIRWTVGHSSHAWDTCERIIDEALCNDNLRVVVACRTFDVEDDVRIKNWKKSQQGRVAEIKVSGLDDETLQRVLKDAGGSYVALSPEQRRILHSPQSLYLWLEIFKERRKPPSFHTTVDLMESFWEFIRRTLPVDPNRLQNALDALSMDMDRRSLPFSDCSVCASWAREVDALISANVLNLNGRKLLFSHQSYLDYLTAERVSRSIGAGNATLVDWLKKDEQSLFRRGQLRQVLSLLREQDQNQFIRSLNDLVTVPGVRFHLRHLALQVLANVELPTPDEIAFVVRLLENGEWRPHIQRYVLYGREQWFDAIHSHGVFQRWLMCSDEAQQNQALWIAQSVISNRINAVSSLVLQRCKSRLQRAKYVLWGVDPGLLDDGLFKACCALCRRTDHDLIVRDWTALSRSHPERAISLFKQQVSRVLQIAQAGIRSQEEVHQPSRDRLEQGEAASLYEAAKLSPNFAWRHLMPVLVRTSNLAAEYRRGQRTQFSTSHYAVGKMAGTYQRVLIRVLIVAGRELALHQPEQFLDVVARLTALSSPVLRRVVAHSLSALPSQYADNAVRWLLADRRRLCCGGTYRSGRSETIAYAPAARLLRRFGSLISNDLIATAETAILHYVPRAEIQNFRGVHNLFMHDSRWMRPRSLFTAQFVLLFSLPRDRLSPQAIDWVGALGRKLGTPESLSERRIQSVGGSVGSTIPPDKIPLISDRQWLDIVTRDWGSHVHRVRQMGPQRVGRIGPDTLSHDLGAAARACPERIARLALQFPLNIDPIYLEAILRVYGEEPPPPQKKSEKSHTLSITHVEAILARFSSMSHGNEFAKAFCWIIRRRAKEPWNESTFAWLTTLATTHSDPPPEDPNGDGLRDVSQTSINCVRGVVAETVALLLHTRTGEVSSLKLAVDSLLIDPHIAMRAAAVGLALPFLNHDRARALDIFLRACDHPDERILQSSHIDTFLSYMILDSADQLRAIVERMLRSSSAETSKRGASWVIEVWTHEGLWGDLYQVAISGSTSQKAGAISNLTVAILDNRGGDDAVADFLVFFDDPQQEVRDLAATVFRYDKFFTHPRAGAIIEAFIKSNAFANNVDDFLLGLNVEAISLRPFAKVLQEIAAKLVSSNDDVKRSTRKIHDTGIIAGLLLRLYEQSEGDAVCRSICLDAWDQLLEHIGYGILEKIDL